MLFRDKVCLLGMSAGEDNQLLACSLELLLSLSHLQHHNLTLACHREHPCAALPPLLLALPYSSLHWISLLSTKVRFPFPVFSEIAGFCNIDHYQLKDEISVLILTAMLSKTVPPKPALNQQLPAILETRF